jgi:type I restriction enzyme, R subunit
LPYCLPKKTLSPTQIANSLAYFVRSLVDLDRTAAHSLFSEFLTDRSLTHPQIRFIEMVIDQLTSRGIMEASSLYEPPFSIMHSGGPDELFLGKETVIDGIFEKLKTINPDLMAEAG